ncbi:complement C3-like isoform X2 [Triplophysa dalaica]|uniref:complement C3-like isoform X2 n=1 Tax=Triplophysa dalaica TaxID=1582913 RepID=UPI0024E0249D|nr:complement C3-like isoform X2 [Triplophysa dalaica]
MKVHLLWSTVVLLSSPLITLCDPLFVLLAPNLLRVGSSENVFVEAQDYNGGDLTVRIVVKNHPRKNVEIFSESVTLTAANKYQFVAKIKIPDDKNYFIDDPLEKQYVCLQAEFPSKILEKVVMVSFQSGYIFVQTDKPIYTPASTVQYRVFSLTPNLHPHSQSGVSVDIMNPQGITVLSEKISPSQGMKSGKYNIPEVASPGIWKVVTRYANTPQTTFTSDFEVKEYVLPTFEVTLMPSKSFFYVGDERLTVDITAEYLFGKKVEGQAFVVFGVMDGESKTSIAASLQRVPIEEGKGSADLTRDMIIQTFPNILQLVGKSLFVSVSVLTETGSEMVEAQKRGIQIVTSPYTIHFKRTSQFFKPGMPFDVSVYVTNPDQTPAENVAVEVNPGWVRGRSKANGIAKVTVNSQGDSPSLQITAKTIDPRLQDEQQAVKTMTAQAYIPKSNSQNYLHVGIDAAELEIGDHMKVNLYTGKSPGAKDQDYTYMIISRGQIVMVDRYKRRGQSLVTLSLPVTKDMVPSFRFLAYYHVGSDEVVSDSVWVDVKDTCTGTLSLEIKNKANTYSPGDRFSLKITGDPGAKVGLVVVDKAVNVLNKNRLTQSKIWDVIEKHDTGCTAASGRDSMGVFYDAGLMFESSTAGGTKTRTMNECPTLSKRRRRSNGDNDDYPDSEDIVSRTQFPESWLWEEVTVPQCKDKTCVLSKDNINLMESITTWQILAISLSNSNGICVADPLEMIVFKNFFVDLKMPYSAVRNEQLEIKAIIHNYTPRKMKVRVEFMETEHICSTASNKHKYRTIVEVEGSSSKTVPYVIIPMELGVHQIEVKAAAPDFITPDGVKKTLKVVSEGVLVELMVKSVELNPEKQGGEQLEVIQTSFPADRIPGTSASTLISITGEETKEQNLNLDVMLFVEGRSKPVRWGFRKANVHVTRSDKFDLNKNFNVTAKGTGTAALSVLMLYYAKPVDKISDCKHFELRLKFERERAVSYPGAEESYKLIMDFFYRSETRDATMSILDVGLLTGFKVDERDLTELTMGRDRAIQKFEMNKELSDRGSLILYVNKVSHKERDRIAFRIHKVNRVGLLQPAAVTVYEYYSPDARCTKNYHPDKEDGALTRLCHGDVCQCAEENCSLQKKTKVSEEIRSDKACEAGMDYVYKVKVIDMTLTKHSDIYNMKVEQVLKEGTDEDMEGKIREFLAHPNCRTSLGIEKDKTYLIMGKSTDLPNLDARLQYILGEQTWIEYWPTREESQTPEHRERYTGLSTLERKLLKEGCSTLLST